MSAEAAVEQTPNVVVTLQVNDTEYNLVFSEEQAECVAGQLQAYFAGAREAKPAPAESTWRDRPWGEPHLPSKE